MSFAAQPGNDSRTVGRAVSVSADEIGTDADDPGIAVGRCRSQSNVIHPSLKDNTEITLRPRLTPNRETNAAIHAIGGGQFQRLITGNGASYAEGSNETIALARVPLNRFPNHSRGLVIHVEADRVPLLGDAIEGTGSDYLTNLLAANHNRC
jgi:hypothetical protein